MSRVQSALRTAIIPLSIVASLASLAGCGGSSAKPGPLLPVTITLAPSTGSVDLGGTLFFTATAVGRTSKTPIAVTVTFSSTNTAVLTIAKNGLACAGSWDSLTLPQVCTPGGAGVAQVTASAEGVTSSPVTVFVHQHIDQILVTALPPLPGTIPPTPGPGGCLSTNQNPVQTISYQATALSAGVDISSTVGPFTWTAVTPAVATVTPLKDVNGILNGQVQATPKTPGLTQIFASIANTNSLPTAFITCPVQSISLAVHGIGGTTITGTKGAAATIDATVIDSNPNSKPIADPLANPPTTVPLTWSSSNPASVTVSSTGAVASPGAGGATITASCIPPTCNVNLVPMQAIYPPTAVNAAFSVASNTTTPTAFNVYTTSSGCGTTLNCTTLIVPITGTPGTGGAGVALPSTPNSFTFSNPPSGTGAGTLKGYLGAQKGLIQLNPANPPIAASSATITGKVLAVSPDGNSVITSDTQAAFNQVFILNVTTGAQTALPVSGAISAAFSPDNLKAFILANNGANLFVFSTQAPLQKAIPLPVPATDIAFTADGAFGFLAGPSGLSFLATCDNPAAPAVGGPIAVTGAVAIRTLPDASGFILLAPPNLVLLPVKVAGQGCNMTATPGTPIPFGLGQGTFTPLDFIVSSDAKKAFILVKNLASVLVFDIPGQAISSIALAGSPAPFAASLTPDGASLYVSASDGNVHKLDTQSGNDVLQISMPANDLCTVTNGPVPPCLPDFIAVRP
jgi:trimeric autotransporter adhesin